MARSLSWSAYRRLGDAGVDFNAQVQMTNAEVLNRNGSIIDGRAALSPTKAVWSRRFARSSIDTFQAPSISTLWSGNLSSSRSCKILILCATNPKPFTSKHAAKTVDRLAPRDRRVHGVGAFQLLLVDTVDRRCPKTPIRSVSWKSIRSVRRAIATSTSTACGADGMNPLTFVFIAASTRRLAGWRRSA